jgi:two-component system chemotaxis response regulator CheB
MAESKANGHDVIGIGASAGGFAALKALFASLPRDLPASVLVALHTMETPQSYLAELLSKAGPLPVAFGRDGERLRRGRIYLAPPDRHLLLDGERIRLGRGPHENGARPSVDSLFRSIAVCCGPRAIGVILTGMLHDGSSGLYAIGRCGGVTVVQDPQDAEFPDMPRNALSEVEVRHVAPLRELGALLVKLAAEPAGHQENVPPELRLEVEIAAGARQDYAPAAHLGEAAGFSCPYCHGAMWEIAEGDQIRYRCHLGHAFSAASLGSMMDDDILRALASAMRALSERAELIRRLGRQEEQASRRELAKHWEKRSREYDEQAALIRRLLLRMGDRASSEPQESTAAIA